MSVFGIATAVATVVVVAGALCFRSRAYAAFRGIQLVIHGLLASALLPHVGVFAPLFVALHVTAYVQSFMLIWPRLRPPWFVAAVSLPGLYFAAALLLALPWAIAASVGLTPHGLWIPFVLGLIGLWQSLTTKVEERAIVLGDDFESSEVARHPGGDARPAASSPLRIVQITDPHLGPFMSVARLRKICERAVDRAPDLVLLTGDFLTMESQADARWLTDALKPLEQLRGRVFACLGNHDHEALEVVISALTANHITLLVDSSVLLETPVGTVQLVGLDFHFRGRAERMATVCQAHPRLPGIPRLLLLHDPGAFKHLPTDEADLVFSGHTHGGQVGLVSLRHPFTMAHAIAGIPDHGLWARGRQRLYVHRGTGHYGFPLRLGVPAEESLLLVYPA